MSQHFPDPPKPAVTPKAKSAELVAPNQIPGRWIYTKCAEKNCKQQLQYWSLTGKQKDEYIGARCDKHGGRK